MRELAPGACDRVAGTGPAYPVVLAGAALMGAGVTARAHADRAGPLASTVRATADLMGQGGALLMSTGREVDRLAGSEGGGEPVDPPRPYRPPVPDLCGDMGGCDFES